MLENERKHSILEMCNSIQFEGLVKVVSHKYTSCSYHLDKLSTYHTILNANDILV